MWLFVIGWFLDSSGGRGFGFTLACGRAKRRENVGPPYPLTNPFAPISEADWVHELTGVVHSWPLFQIPHPNPKIKFSTSTHHSHGWMDAWMDDKWWSGNSFLLAFIQLPN